MVNIRSVTDEIFLRNMLKMVLGTYLYSLIKVGSVTAKIFLIWTYVTRTNVAWTNVTVMISIY